MSNLDLITILLFSIGVLATGIAFSRTGKDMKSFFAGGGNVPWGMSGLSLFMGFFSAGTFVVWGSIAYSYGFVAVMIQMTMALAGFIVGTWIAPRWQRTHSLTAAQYISERLGVNVQKFYTYIFLVVSVFTTGSFLYPVAKIVEVAAGIPLTYSILGLGVFSMIYVSIGGLRGVIVTDVLQFIILFSAVIIVVPLSFEKVGGLGNFIDSVPAGFMEPVHGEYSWWFLLAFCVYNSFFLGGNWAYVQRYTSVKSANDSKKVGWLFGGLYLVSALLWMLPPMLYRIYDPSLGGLDNENAYLLMCKLAMPQGLLGLMLGGMIFATASSLNATLNISAGVFTNDIFKRISPKASDKTLMRVARLSTLGFGLLALIVALLVKSMGGIVNVVISVAALTGVPIYLPIIWSLFSRRQNARSILTVTLLSLAVTLSFKFLTPLLGLTLSRGAEMGLGAFVPVALLAFAEIYLKSKNYVDPKYLAYAARKHNDNTLPAAQSDAANRYTRRVLGLSISVAGLFIAALGCMAESSRYIPIIMGLIVLTVGLVIRYKK
ncbi:MAG: Na+:solute symporter [Duncaniella sp.]|nr:sodium:solute symporter family protein [Duncaniella sp.]MDE5989928.1 Na+:solute symporter [Duncaniella sp.]